MSDLASVINRCPAELGPEEVAGAHLVDTEDCIPPLEEENPVIPSLRLTKSTVLAKDEYILGIFEDGFCPGQVITDYGDSVDAIFMKEVKLKDTLPKLFWKWMSGSTKQTLRKTCILEICPNSDVVLELSTRQHIIYKLLNLEIVEKFAN